MPLSAPTTPQPKPVPRGRPYAALPLLWAAVILWLTLTPANEMPRTPVWELLSFDTAAHAGVFVVLAGLSWFSLRRQRRWPLLARHAGAVVLVGSSLFGGLIEVLQHSMRRGRHGDWTDLLSDGIGAALAVGVATAWSARQARRARELGAVVWLGVLLAATAPAHAQDIARARRTIEKLAAPELRGRGYVQQGEHKAAAYLRGRLGELKLEPLAPNYTQPFTLDVNTFPGALKLRLLPAGKPNAEGLLLQPGVDFIVAPSSASAAERASAVVTADTLVFTNSAARTTALLPGYPDSQPHGVLVLRQRDETRLQLPENADLRERWQAQYRARMVLVDKLTASISSRQGKQPEVEILATKWPMDENGHSVYAAVELQLDAQLQRSYKTQNLAAIVRGSVQPDSFLVVTAHYDHLGMMGSNTYFPGANDNASGVALLLELAAHYARPENRPACSVAFLLFGAEEAGLVGSRYFVAHPL
ncbi:MAG TPA: M28 family peptidase, partial [Hymenobacter sp.]